VAFQAAGGDGAGALRQGRQGLQGPQGQPLRFRDPGSQPGGLVAIGDIVAAGFTPAGESRRSQPATRRADPGELIWRTVALRAVTELSLRMEPERVWGSGLPLPAAWGIDGGGRY
jgi:hypothetical protein